jgi:TonB family protein
MKTLRFYLVVAGVLILASMTAWAGSVKVVANQSIGASAISADELKSVFLEEKNSLNDGTHVEPVLAKGGAAHEAFVKDYLGKSDSVLQTYYRSLVFSGKGSMPKTLHSDEEVVAYVAKTRGAIGYVGPGARADGVKTLVVSESGNYKTRELVSRVEPMYPDILRSNHIGGTVRLQVSIAPNGKAEDVELLGGSPILGEAAMAAVKQWVYAPGRSRTLVEVSVNFDPSR